MFKRLGVKMTPELKSASVTMPFDGFTQEAYAQKLIDEYKAAGVTPRQVWPQSFNKRRRAVLGAQRAGVRPTSGVPRRRQRGRPSCRISPSSPSYKAQGINIWAPPTFALLATDSLGRIVPSQAAIDAKTAGLDIITWTLERSGILADGNNGFYFQTFDSAIKTEGDTYRALDVLARQIRILGIFSDWPATVTFYANCMDLD